MHNAIMNFTKDKPMKQIDVGGKPYLQRYFIGTALGGEDLWLHRFLGADVAEHLHNHPSEAHSVVLTGQYTEDLETHFFKGPRVRRPAHFANATAHEVLDELMPLAYMSHLKLSSGLINPFTWHRITRAEKDTWTLMIVEPARLPFWYFKEPDGSYRPVESNPRDWYKGAKTR